MSAALTKAFADSQRSYLSAKAAATAIVGDDLLARGPAGIPNQRADLVQAGEQLRHFKGWVYSAIRPIAQRIAGLPIRVGRASSAHKLGTKQADGIEPLQDHELLRLFSDPNDLMVAWSLMFCTIASLELTGRQLWWLPKRKQIYPIPTSWIRGFNGTSRFTSFTVQPPYSGEPMDLPADECVLFAYPSPSDPHGAVSPLQAVAGAVDSDEAIVTSQASMFRKGIHPAHALIVGKDAESKLRPRLSADQQRQIIEAIRKRYAGTHQHGDPLILDGLIEDVKVLSSTPKEMDYLKSGEAARQRIMLGFGVSPIIAGMVEGSNRASSDAADRHFIDFTINPKIELLSQTLTGWCRYVFDDPTLVVWIEKPVANDADTALRWATLLAQNSAITGDELRSLAPFGLEVGKFPQPVATPAPPPPDPQVDAALKTLDRAMSDLDKSFKRFSPARYADVILEDVDRPTGTGSGPGLHYTNGRH